MSPKMHAPRRRLAFPLLVLVLVLLALGAPQTGSAQGPDIVDVLNVAQISAPRISPDGSAVIYTKTVPDWSENRYDSEVFLADAQNTARQLTRSPHGSATNAQWAAGGDGVFYIADLGHGPQIHLQELSGSVALPVTAITGGLLDYAVSPDGRHLALLLAEGPDPEILARRETLGRFTIVGEAPPAAHLWLLDIGAAIEDGGASRHGTHALRRLTGGSDRSVTLFSEAGLRRAFSFSPDGRHIVFSHADSALILDTIRSDISIVDTTTGDVRPVVVSDHWDETPLFSPDGTQILFGRTVVSDWLEDKALMVVPTTGGQARRLSIGFSEDVRDTQPLLVDWGVQGIEALFLSGTDRLIYRIEPETGRAARISPAELRVQEADVSDDGGTLAFVGVEATQAPEVYRLDLAHGGGAERLSHASGALADWPNHASFLVHWMTEDAVRIEGVLYQPEGLSPRARAPLIVVLHGGPRDVAYPARLHNQMYPIEQWLARGARILFPNYRGSTGYGASFRQLIVGNTGQAEMQDIAAAVEHFVATGLADEQQIGVVGHSWGGYLAAFAAATTDLFAAISVGSGISDNRVNYALSIAGVAEEGYLGSLPWAKLELWSATSPITHVTGEEAPVLILHGVDDAVVPVANAQLLHKALTDMGAIARLVLFDETGHDVSRPKEMRAWMQLNLEWFSQHLWRDERTDRRGDG